MWSKKELCSLYDLINNKKKSWSDVANTIGKTINSCRNRYRRTDWKLFNSNSESAVLPQKEWSKEELVTLYSLKTEAKMSYKDIASRLGRTPISCERKFQTTIWNENNTNLIKEAIERKETDKQNNTNDIVDRLAAHMVNLSRNNVDKLEEMSKAYFIEKNNLKESELPIPFKDIKEIAKQMLQKMGLCYDAQINLGKGTYIIVGDSHGKHTRRHTINMVKNLNSLLKAKNVIHIGHMLDDDNESSYCWEDFKNLIILAKREELQILSDKKYKYNIVRNEIFLGDLSVCNQDEINDYTNSYIGTIKKQVFPNTTILNLHRHELDTRTSVEGESSQLISPGCLCEPHIVRTIKQINWEAENVQVKLAYWDGFTKYRRMRHKYVFWEQGLLVVHVDDNNNFDIIPCRIQKTSKGYTTSYFNKIITESGVFDPQEKIFFNGDAHVKSHDENVLSLQEQFCIDYKPDTAVNIGDVSDNKPLNHHEMTKNGWAINKSVLDEYAGVHYVLKRMRKWAKNFQLIFGNHERFAKDFVAKLPQFGDLLKFSFLTDLESLGINLTEHKEILRLGKLKFIHGDLKMFGARGGSKLEKISQVIGENTIIGDIHYPSVRYGCYSVGLTGKLDQEYNETSVTRWMHGFGFCNIFDGKCFISLVNINKYRFSINNKTYIPQNPSVWQIPLYKASINYNFD
jgi:hypothetical protein